MLTIPASDPTPRFGLGRRDAATTHREGAPEKTRAAASAFARRASIAWLGDKDGYRASPHKDGPAVLAAPLPLRAPERVRPTADHD